MNSGRARDLFEKYAAAMAYVAVEHPNGDRGIGSAFHVGEGVFVTARHVVEGKRIQEIASTERTYIRLEGDEAISARCRVNTGTEEFPAHLVNNSVMQLSRGPFFHPKQNVDVAVFQVAEIDPKTPVVHLGDHLDDWLGCSDFVLTEAIVLGYPPIPFTVAPQLFAARAEVNALIDVRDTDHVHFILSAMPRGGFSGGVVISESEIVLGVITRSLLSSEQAEELGYFCVMSVEPIYNCLAQNKLLPDCQAEGWDDFWNTDDLGVFYDPRINPDPARFISTKAHLRLFDNGKRVHLEILCDDLGLFDSALITAEETLQNFTTRRELIRPGMVKLKLDGDYVETRRVIDEAVWAVRAVFNEAGLKQGR